MPRKPNVVPSYELTLCIPEDLFAKLSLELWSEAEGRVPHGAFKRFFEELLREHFLHSRLDLSAFIPGLPPGVHFISGRKEVLEILAKEVLC